ncbi:MAG: DUF1570 domain-containing protein [Planctomycetota bacterium]|nr:DUF1570 domain-containing protein [Planctomycetota bacterium]
MTKLSLLLTSLALVLAFAPAATAQRNKAPKNDPASCEYCAGDPERMAPAGIVSHGGFEFGRTDTAAVDEQLGNCDIRWIETEHFEIGFAGPPYSVSGKEKKGLIAELEELNKVLPEVSPKTKILDPWLRAHMYAARCEAVYAKFLDTFGLEQSQFPDGKTQWNGRGDYWGEGPHVGQKGKFEVLIVPGEGDLVTFLKEQFGLHTKVTNRWNVIDRDSITVTIHLRQADLTKDISLHAHVAFNLAHNLLDGLQHYNYDTPIWIHEGLAHNFGRAVSPKHNSFDSGEGSAGVRSKKEKWQPEVVKMIKSGKAPRMAELIQIKSYADLTLDQHFATWSMVKFLIEEHQEAFAKLNLDLHGRLMADGTLDSENLPQVHRDSMKEHFGWSYQDFDKAWQDWALGIVPEKEDLPIPGQ